MATKKTKEKVEDKVVTKSENTELKALIEIYKTKNPVKYEQKKAELEAKLNK